jgi:hypothetical protein
MKSLIPVFCAFCIVAPGYAQASSPKEQNVGHCYQSYRDPKRTTCEVSPIAVIANPDRYEGMNISLTGYLRHIDNSYVLFPSKDLYFFSAGTSGIELLGAPKSISKLLDGKDEASRAVTVLGDFTSKVRGSLRSSIGVLHGDLVVFSEDMPGEPPKSRPDSR